MILPEYKQYLVSRQIERRKRADPKTYSPG